jgi:hypothetical protein
LIHAALRSYATAGVALVGAGVIAVSPLAPPPVAQSATNTISTAQVALTSTVDPLTRWSQIASNTGEDIGEIANYWLENPMPLTRQIATNLSTYAEWYISGVQNTIPALQNWAESVMAPALNQAVELTLAGQPEQAAAAVANAIGLAMFYATPMMKLLDIPNLVFDHASALLKATVSPTMVTLAGLAMGFPQDIIRSVGASAQDAVDAAEAGDLMGAAFAIANIPTDYAQTQLDKVFSFRKWGSCGCNVAGGLIVNQLIKLPRQLAKAIALPAPAAATAGTLAITAPKTPELPAATGTTVEADPAAAASPVSTGSPAPAAAPESAPAESKATDETPAAVKVSSTGATDLSAGNKAVPGKVGTTSSRTNQLRASLQNTAHQVGNGINNVRDGIEKSIKGLSDNVGKAVKTPAKKKASSASSTSSDGADSDS